MSQEIARLLLENPKRAYAIALFAAAAGAAVLVGALRDRCWRRKARP